MANCASNGCSVMDAEQMQLAGKDPFLNFIDYARSILCATEKTNDGGDSPENGVSGEVDGPGWSWIASRILKTCVAYSSGVTAAIILSEISQAWSEQRRMYAPGKSLECISKLRKKHRRSKLPNWVSIDSIVEKNFLSLNSVLEAVIVDAFVLPGTNIYMLKLGDFWSSNTIDLYLHRRYYELVSTDYGVLRKEREVILTGCYLRSANEGFGHLRLLPTEYMVILLDEDQDDDAMLLGAQFCSDSFSSISLDAAHKGVSYSLYARIDSIGSVENIGQFGGTQRLQVNLVDDDGMQLKFVLWGEQIILANLLSVRSMLAIDSPFIASSVESAVEGHEVCLEYGGTTQLYLVPYAQKEEQVCISLTPNRSQGSNHSISLTPTQGSRVSQVTLPCNSLGSVDFSNYPFQYFIIDLHDKMTGVSLYGVVVDILREKDTASTIFLLKIKDSTGTIWAKLHFIDSWSLGRLGLGHTVYISGMTSCMTKQKRLEALWFESDSKASLINLSSLPAMLNSSCLHQRACLAEISMKKAGTHICQVWLDQVENWHVNTTLCHRPCGNFIKNSSGSLECEFCCCSCSEVETRRVFQLKLTVADESAKGLAWCTGETAIELLQISPDEFDELPEEEQVMYPISLENERYMVAISICHQEGTAYTDRVSKEYAAAPWQITRALKL